MECNHTFRNVLFKCKSRNIVLLIEYLTWMCYIVIFFLRLHDDVTWWVFFLPLLKEAYSANGWPFISLTTVAQMFNTLQPYAQIFAWIVSSTPILFDHCWEYLSIRRLTQPRASSTQKVYLVHRLIPGLPKSVSCLETRASADKQLCFCLSCLSVPEAVP